MANALHLGKISRAEHLAFVQSQPSASFLQTPAWGTVKDGWRAESLGWRRDGVVVGAALVLHRRVPILGRHLAYIPEGPLIDWSSDGLSAWLEPLRDYLEGHGAFALRMGPPIPSGVWEPATVKGALAGEKYERIGDVPPDEEVDAGREVETWLSHAGWRAPPPGSGFPAGQPRYVVQLDLAGQSEEDLLAGMNKQWRRNVKKAGSAGVIVRDGEASELETFHDMYLETAKRNGFRPRPAHYFKTMYSALRTEEDDRIGMLMAEHDGRVVAGALSVRVGDHVWYAYGASRQSSREVRGFNAMQWHAIRKAQNEGANVYDLRGVRDSLAPGCPTSGLLRFKLGAGGHVIGYVGEWTLPISHSLHAAFDLFMRRRFG